MIGSHVERFHVDWLGVTYANPETTIVGGAAFAFESIAFVVPMIHYVRAMRAGVRGAAPSASLAGCAGRRGAGGEPPAVHRVVSSSAPMSRTARAVPTTEPVTLERPPARRP